jgi:hypothetical protein
MNNSLSFGSAPARQSNAHRLALAGLAPLLLLLAFASSASAIATPVSGPDTALAPQGAAALHPECGLLSNSAPSGIRSPLAWCDGLTTIACDCVPAVCVRVPSATYCTIWALEQTSPVPFAAVPGLSPPPAFESTGGCIRVVVKCSEYAAVCVGRSLPPAPCAPVA